MSEETQEFTIISQEERRKAIEELGLSGVYTEFAKNPSKNFFGVSSLITSLAIEIVKLNKRVEELEKSEEYRSEVEHIRAERG